MHDPIWPNVNEIAPTAAAAADTVSDVVAHHCTGLSVSNVDLTALISQRIILAKPRLLVLPLVMLFSCMQRNATSRGVELY